MVLSEWLTEFKQRKNRRLTFSELRDKRDRERSNDRSNTRLTHKSWLF